MFPVKEPLTIVVPADWFIPAVRVVVVPLETLMLPITVSVPVLDLFIVIVSLNPTLTLPLTIRSHPPVYNNTFPVNKAVGPKLEDNITVPEGAVTRIRLVAPVDIPAVTLPDILPLLKLNEPPATTALADAAFLSVSTWKLVSTLTVKLLE